MVTNARHGLTKLGGKVDPTRLHAVETGHFAMTTGVAVGSNAVDGESTTASIRSSAVVRKRHGVWKAISYQTDKLPYLEDAA